MHATDSLLLAIVASTPLLLAVEGELTLQRGGIINLGIEGMMLMAAMTSVIGTQVTHSLLFGFASGVAGAAVIAAIFGIFAIALKADQIVTGAAINLLSLGLTGFAYREMQQTAIFQSALPSASHDWAVPFAWVLAPIALALLLWRSDFGLVLRASGENSEAVTAAGHSVTAHRWIALAVEAMLIGVAGVHLALVLSNGFAENMTAGRGFVALSIVIFGRWKIKGALLGTALFGLAAAAQYALQASGIGLPFHLLLAVPYIVTLLILCGITGGVRAPEALGRS